MTRPVPTRGRPRPTDRPIVDPPPGGFQVQVPMPGGWGGHGRIGWLNLNNSLPASRGGAIQIGKKHRAWREAARDAYKAARIPTGLPRVRVQAILHFAEIRTRDPANWEPTLKPIIDAMLPTKTVRSKKAPSGFARITGHGLVAGDDPRYMERPETIIGQCLPMDSPFGGMVTLNITPLPPLDQEGPPP